jgi:hypothetical protein
MRLVRARRIAVGLNGVAATAVAVAVAVAVAGCGGASTPAGSVIARAADVSDAATGYTVQMSMNEMVPGAGTVQIAGTGAFSRVSHSGEMTMTVQAAGQNLQLQEIILGPTFYVKEPPAVAAKLPGGKPWLEVDLSKAGGQYLSTVSSLMSSSSETNPAAFLDYLKAESNQVKDLGQATVAGVTTTHYRATIDLDKAGTGQPASIHALDQRLLKQLPGKVLDSTDLPADVWIDASHRVREMNFTMKVIPNSLNETIPISVNVIMTGYGPQATPTPPPASQTLNLLALLKAHGETGLLSGG